MNHYIQANSAIDFFTKMCKYILDNGEKYGDIIECRNTYSDINNFADNDVEKDKLFRKIFGDERIDWAKKVTFFCPSKEEDVLTDEMFYRYNILPKDEKRDSYFGRLTGQCGGMTRNQFDQMIKRLKEGKNSKTCQMVIFRETDIYNNMSQPCCISINCSPRDDKLDITANFRSMAISKAGYADAQAMIEMGQFLAQESGLKLNNVGIFAHSSHLRGKDGEMIKAKEYMRLVV